MDQEELLEQAPESRVLTVRKTKTLPVKMTVEEKLAVANEAAELMATMEQLKSDMADIRDAVKDRNNKLDEALKRLRRGTIDKEIDCEFRFNYGEKIKTLFRLDTGENMGNFPLTKDEMQLDVEMEEVDDDPSAEVASEGAGDQPERSEDEGKPSSSPADSEASEDEVEFTEPVDERPAEEPSGAPPCPDCGEVMVYDGTLWLCPACGQTKEEENDG